MACGQPATQSAMTVPDIITITAAVGVMSNAFAGIGLQEMERQFVAWNRERGVTPDNHASALYGFLRQKVRRAG